MYKFLKEHATLRHIIENGNQEDKKNKYFWLEAVIVDATEPFKTNS